MIKTLDQLIDDAIQVQNASNLSGVAYTLFNDVIPTLRHLGINGSDDIAQHPVTRAFILKMADLAELDISDEILDPDYENVDGTGYTRYMSVFSLLHREKDKIKLA